MTKWVYSNAFWLLGAFLLAVMVFMEVRDKETGAAFFGLLAVGCFAYGFYDKQLQHLESVSAYDRALAVRSRKRSFKLIKGGRK